MGAGRDGPSYADADIKRATINETTAASNEIVAAVAGKKILVLEFHVTTTLANTLKWLSAAGALTGPMDVPANGTIQADYVDEGHFETLAGEALNLAATVATAHGGWMVYVEL